MFTGDFIHKRQHTPAIRILSHVLFWVAIYYSTYYFIQSSYSIYKDTPLAYLVPFRHSVSLMVSFYLLMYVILPSFLQRKRWLSLLGYLLLLLFVYTFMEALGEKWSFAFCDSCRQIAAKHNPNHLEVMDKSLIENILYKGSNVEVYINLLSSLALPVAIKSSLAYYTIYVKNLELEKENVQLELNFLKGQVNPHFLFNTLNNLYGLILQEQKELSAEMVTRLSDYLRYSLEYAPLQKVTIEKEVQLMQNYIELERLRLNFTQVHINFELDQPKTDFPPLLFLPLLENAFKYSKDKEGAEINIRLQLKNEELEFWLDNSYQAEAKHSESGGIGLQNLQKRLQLNFGDHYIYKVETLAQQYKVYLKLLLK
ncbi:MAG: sensor histidine kinase [Flavobacteriaceae bacterium]|nr:sensor histidine kinase [Flavobacteriaceae bacterium]